MSSSGRERLARRGLCSAFQATRWRSFHSAARAGTCTDLTCAAPARPRRGGLQGVIKLAHQLDVPALLAKLDAYLCDTGGTVQALPTEPALLPVHSNCCLGRTPAMWLPPCLM